MKCPKCNRVIISNTDYIVCSNCGNKFENEECFIDSKAREKTEDTKPMQTKYEELAIRIGQQTDKKNAAYGDSANTSAKAFKLLYPDGINPEQYTDALLLIRIWDKMKRIATRKNAFGENPFEDITGYGLIGAMKDEQK